MVKSVFAHALWWFNFSPAEAQQLFNAGELAVILAVFIPGFGDIIAPLLATSLWCAKQWDANTGNGFCINILGVIFENKEHRRTVVGYFR